MRICSLLPSATEMVFALGLGSNLAGVSHECDFPPEAARLPKLTRSNIPSGLPSRAIDAAVSSTLGTAGSLYELDLPLLESLQPDLILTQRLCDVCAVSFDRVQEAVKSLPSHPQILNLEPRSVGDIFENVRQVAAAASKIEAGEGLTRSLRERVEAVHAKTKNLRERPRVLCMEWVDPPYCGGHWMKELVDLAGGRDELARPHRPSVRMEWKEVLEFSPEVIALTCCGFDLERSAQEGELLIQFEGARNLPAVRAGKVYAADASHFFSRPGPRIVESMEVLAHIIHPEIFPPPPLPDAFRRLTFQ
ncbi:MAG: cobalamin-binding protein [Terriglobia bacterium]